MKFLTLLSTLLILISCGRSNNQYQGDLYNDQITHYQPAPNIDYSQDCTTFEKFMTRQNESEIDGTYFLSTTAAGNESISGYLSIKGNMTSFLSLCEINGREVCSSVSTSIDNDEINSIIYFNSKVESQTSAFIDGRSANCSQAIVGESLQYFINSNGSVSFSNNNFRTELRGTRVNQL